MGWKQISGIIFETGLRDSNGKIISVGDLIAYKKRIRSGSYVKGQGCVSKGYTKEERVRVIGFCHRVRTDWKQRVFVIDYIVVETLDRSKNKFRLYRTDKTSIMK